MAADTSSSEAEVESVAAAATPDDVEADAEVDLGVDSLATDPVDQPADAVDADCSTTRQPT